MDEKNRKPLIKRIPNILCGIRVALIPVILALLVDNPLSRLILPDIRVRYIVCGIIFFFAMITDILDGVIARKCNAESNFGRFIDPIADKLIVLSLLTAFVDAGIISTFPVVVILAREFFVTGLRLAAAGHGNVVSANWWGKIKTWAQALSIGACFVFVLIYGRADVLSVSYIPEILMWLVAGYSAVSSIPYYKATKKYLKD